MGTVREWISSLARRARVAVRGGPLRRALKLAAVLFAGCSLAAAFAGGAGYYEYRTNRFAEWIGSRLMDSNPSRPATGRIWQDLRTQAAMREALDHEPAEPVSLPGQKLPDAVAAGRFEAERIPVEGLPGFVAIWRTPIPPGREASRGAPDVVESLRIYRQAHALLEAAAIPEVRYRTRVQREIESLYRQLGRADSADLSNPDSTWEAVSDELAHTITERLRREERERLVLDLEAGRVSHILLNRGLGVYQAEVFHHDPDVPAVAFQVDTERVREALRVESTREDE